MNTHTRGSITGNSFIELQSCIPAEPVVLCAARRIEQLSSTCTGKVVAKWLEVFFNDTAEPLILGWREMVRKPKENHGA